MKKLSRTQLDLFVTPAGPVVELTGSERQKAVALLLALLTEAMAPAISRNDQSEPRPPNSHQ